MRRRRGFVAPRKSGDSSSSTPNATAAPIKTPALTTPITTTMGAAVGNATTAHVVAPNPSGAISTMRKSAGFSVPQRKVIAPMPATSSGTVANKKVNNAEALTRHYRVLYTARSNKKRKTFDDGVLVLNGKKAILMDLEGKVVTQTLYKSTDILPDGATLDLGSKELEVTSLIPEEEFMSGKVFLSTDSSRSTNSKSNSLTNTFSSSTTKSATQGAKKRFKNPNAAGVTQAVVVGQAPSLGSAKTVGNGGMRRPTWAHTRMMHDPNANDALVLVRTKQQGKGVEEEEVCVVVDPLLGDVLRPHQGQGVQFLFDCVTGRNDSSQLGCILADEMGLGKTLQVIALIWTLLKQGTDHSRNLIEKAIIVCPASLTHNWKSEFRKWVGGRRIAPIAVTDGGKAGKAKIDEFACNRSKPVLIISYETFRANAKKLNAIKSVDLLVLDEGHRLKSSKGNQTITALQACPTRKRILLTGTPVQNSMDEFYAMVSFVCPSLLGGIATFKRVFQQPIARGQDRDASETEIAIAKARGDELQTLTQRFVLRRTSEILHKHLPDKVTINVFVRMNATQEMKYRRVLKGSGVSMLLGGGGGADALQLITKLKQIATHPKLSKNDPGESAGPIAGMQASHNSTSSGGSSSKFQVLTLLLRAVREMTPTDRIVLVSNYTATLDLLAAMCNTNALQFVCLDGSTPQKKRETIVRQFNAGSDVNDVFCLLLSSKAGGCGLNLIGGNRLVLVDPDWNPATDLQAMARVWRQGQKKKVFIYRMFSTGTIEERILQRQLLKNGLMSVVDGCGNSKPALATKDSSASSSSSGDDVGVMEVDDDDYNDDNDDVDSACAGDNDAEIDATGGNGAVTENTSSSDDDGDDILEPLSFSTSKNKEKEVTKHAVKKKIKKKCDSSGGHQFGKAAGGGGGMSASSFKRGAFSRNELRELFTLNTDTQCDTFDKLANVGGVGSDGRSALAKSWTEYHGPAISLAMDPPLQHAAEVLGREVVTWVQVEGLGAPPVDTAQEEYTNVDWLE